LQIVFINTTICRIVLCLFSFPSPGLGTHLPGKPRLPVTGDGRSRGLGRRCVPKPGLGNEEKDMSADKRTRYLAEIREKALKNERSMLAAERKEGIREGRQEGIKEGIKKGGQNTARMLLKMGVLSPEQIAQATGLSTDEIRQLQESEK